MAMVLENPQHGGYRHFTMQEFENSSSNQMSETDSRMTASNHRPISALARGVQITEFAESRINPTPHILDESDILIEQYLSPGKLQMLTGVDDLHMVQSLELKVDSRETSLGNFGSMLPNLTELKLSGSCIQSVRDLGSSLHHLHVLWLTRCGLEELDGISSMLNLSELYLEYNEISDISSLSMLEELQILDLEGNNIEELAQVQYLSLCPKLRKLALDGNPICVAPSPDEVQLDYNYRESIQKCLPHLKILDDEQFGKEGSEIMPHNVFNDDWAFLEELQEDALLKDHFSEETEATQLGASGGDRPLSAALRPATGYTPGSTLRPSSGFRPLSARRTLSGGRPRTTSKPSSAAHRPVSSDAVEGLEATSELTMGSVICGNPSKALRQRKNSGPGSKADVQRGLSKLLQKGAVFCHSENAEAIPFQPEEEMSSIIEELQVWKEEHEKRMEEIIRSKEAQILVVDHDEAEDVVSSSDSETDVVDLNFSSETSLRHTADLLLKPKTKEVRSREQVLSPRSKHSERPVTPKLRTTSKYAILRGSVESFDHDSEVREDVSAEAISERPSSLLYQKRLSLNSSSKEEPCPDFDMSPRPNSRGQSRAEPLAPLRAPSPTSAQLISQARTKQVQSPQSPRAPRKLRVGPTGLPVSSQQPVIRNALGTTQQRSSLNLAPNTPSSTSRGNIALLPSQPRISRHLPEPPSMVPHPPKN